MFLRIALALLCLALAAPAAPDEKLQYVVMMSRHGVRSPLLTQAELNMYSTEPWPEWNIPLGYLTAHGRKLMELMGDYYHEYFIHQQLLPASGCDAANRFFFWSDVDERDVETGHALAEHMFPGCNVPVPALPINRLDPLFNPVKAGLGKTDPQHAAAAILERIGGQPEALEAKYRPQFDLTQKIVLGCEPAKTCPPAAIAGKRLLYDQPTAVRAQPGLLASVVGPLPIASAFVDIFLLEYTEGMKGRDLGWGRVDKATVKQLLAVQEADTDLVLRTPYLARASGSNLMSHMLRSLQQSLGEQPLDGAMGKPGDLGVVILGHDSNESNLSGLLNISWPNEDYPVHGRPPGSALIFEMWKNSATGKSTVRTWFVTQTLDQMRNAVPLSLKNSPVRVSITIPGCGGEACDWQTFQKIVEADIDPAFISNQAIR